MQGCRWGTQQIRPDRLVLIVSCEVESEGVAHAVVNRAVERCNLSTVEEKRVLTGIELYGGLGGLCFLSGGCDTLAQLCDFRLVHGNTRGLIGSLHHRP